MMCAKLPRFIVTLQPKGDLLCKELVGLDITEELTLADLTPQPPAAAELLPRAEAPKQGLLSSPPIQLPTRQLESRGPPGPPLAVPVGALHAREEERVHVEGPPQRVDCEEGGRPSSSWMDALAFPHPSSASLSTQNRLTSRTRSNSINAPAAAAASAAETPGGGGPLHPVAAAAPAAAAAAPAAPAAAAADGKPRLNPQLNQSVNPPAQQATHMQPLAHAEKVCDASGLPPSRLLPAAASSTNRVETSGEPPVTKKPRKEMNFSFLEELDI
ncbi:hypothetical protein Emed_006615 [Eimeria media]